MKNAPNRDRIIIWSAIIAGSGIMALMIRHAAIYRFATDEFTGNVLFAVSLILLIGLCLGFQSVIDTFFSNISSRRRDIVAIAETPSGEKIAIPATEESVMECSASIAEPEICTDEPDMSPEYLAFLDEQMERDLEQAYLNSLTEQEREDLENGITRIRKEKVFDDNCGCFTTIQSSEIHKQEDGTTLIEEFEEGVYLTADGDVYDSASLDSIINFYKENHTHAELQKELVSQHHKCEEAYNELRMSEEIYNLEQVSFICAYITHTMEQFMDAQELKKLHHNAKLWTVKPTAPFSAVQLRSNHLSKEDLKHLGYNIGKFLRLSGEIIAIFVKNTFEEPFNTLQLRTIIAKLADTNPKDRIPLLSADQMDALFKHYKRYKKINLNVIPPKEKKKR